MAEKEFKCMYKFLLFDEGPLGWWEWRLTRKAVSRASAVARDKAHKDVCSD
jgi:hypothetical protein